MVFTVICLGLLGYIASFILEASGEVATGAGQVVAERVSKQLKNKMPKQEGTIIDDSGSGMVTEEQIAAEIKSRKQRKKDGTFSLQNSAGGAKFAPWMDIDEERVAQMKKDREARKKQEKGQI